MESPGKITPVTRMSDLREKGLVDLREKGLVDLLDDVYKIRNTFIAHQKEEPKDVETTRSALKTWAQAMGVLYAAHQ